MRNPRKTDSEEETGRERWGLRRRGHGLGGVKEFQARLQTGERNAGVFETGDVYGSTLVRSLCSRAARMGACRR